MSSENSFLGKRHSPLEPRLKVNGYIFIMGKKVQFLRLNGLEPKVVDEILKSCKIDIFQFDHQRTVKEDVVLFDYVQSKPANDDGNDKGTTDNVSRPQRASQHTMSTSSHSISRGYYVPEWETSRGTSQKCCWHCTGMFGVDCCQGARPLKVQVSLGEYSGEVCGFPCYKALVLDELRRGNVMYQNSLTYMNAEYQRLFGKLNEIPCALEKKCLQKYGGMLTYEQYHRYETDEN